MTKNNLSQRSAFWLMICMTIYDESLSVDDGPGQKCNCLINIFPIGKKWSRNCLVFVEKPLVKFMMVSYLIALFPVDEICFMLGRRHVWLKTSRLCKQWNKIVIRYTLFRFTCYHGTQPFGAQLLSFGFNAEIIYRMQGEECREWTMPCKPL